MGSEGKTAIDVFYLAGQCAELAEEPRENLPKTLPPPSIACAALPPTNVSSHLCVMTVTVGKG